MQQRKPVIRTLVFLSALALMLTWANPLHASSATVGFAVDCAGAAGFGSAQTDLFWKIHIQNGDPSTGDFWAEGKVAAGSPFDVKVSWGGHPIIDGTAMSSSYYWWRIYNGSEAPENLIAEGEGHFDCEPPPPPPPGGTEGCTPGYWKARQHFDAWVGYMPNDSFEAVFGVDVPGSPTLLDALSAGGGGLDALMRHATAALLNAASPDVAYAGAYTSPAQVIAAVQNAIQSGDYEPLKDALDAANNAGCPLN